MMSVGLFYLSFCILLGVVHHGYAYIPVVRGFRSAARQRLVRLSAQSIPIAFVPDNENDSFGPTEVSAEVGEELSEVAEKAKIPIGYVCRKGECGTCEVNINGRWEKACQTQIRNLDVGEDKLKITVKKVTKKPSKFFSPMSFAEGVFNNGLGKCFVLFVTPISLPVVLARRIAFHNTHAAYQFLYCFVNLLS